MNDTNIEQRYDMLCEASKKQLATIQQQRRQIVMLQDALQQAQTQLRRVADQSRVVQEASFALRTEVIAVDVQLKAAEVARRRQQDVEVSKPTICTTIGPDGRYE